jgi:hypothetical protein
VKKPGNVSGSAAGRWADPGGGGDLLDISAQPAGFESGSGGEFAVSPGEEEKKAEAEQDSQGVENGIGDINTAKAADQQGEDQLGGLGAQAHGEGDPGEVAGLDAADEGQAEAEGQGEEHVHEDLETDYIYRLIVIDVEIEGHQVDVGEDGASGERPVAWQGERKTDGAYQEENIKAEDGREERKCRGVVLVLNESQEDGEEDEAGEQRVGGEVQHPVILLEYLNKNIDGWGTIGLREEL